MMRLLDTFDGDTARVSIGTRRTLIVVLLTPAVLPSNASSNRIMDKHWLVSWSGRSGLGGACMASYPFLTINPNIGYCLVPAPADSCQEDDAEQSHTYASPHGQDPQFGGLSQSC